MAAVKLDPKGPVLQPPNPPNVVSQQSSGSTNNNTQTNIHVRESKLVRGDAANKNIDEDAAMICGKLLSLIRLREKYAPCGITQGLTSVLVFPCALK